MNELQFKALLPYSLLATASIIVILLIAFKRNHFMIQVVGFLLMCGVIFALVQVRPLLPVAIPPLFQVDGFALLFTGLIIGSVAIVGLFSYIYFEAREENPKEYYILLFLSTLGSAILVISNHFVSFFLGLEILSVSLYGLIAYLRNRNHAVEAGMKYLVLAALTSAFLLFGMALIYMDTGTMSFPEIAQKLSESGGSSVLFVMGMGFIVVAVGFKLALVPFHLWAADVYQGAPVPVTAFIATVSKIGVFAILLRFSLDVNLQNFPLAIDIFAIIAIASMIIGNLLALRQANLKRLLAYSSIAHLGYLLVAFLPGNMAGVEAAVFYLLAYSITLLSAFGIITMLSTRKKDADDVEIYRGLFWKKPLMALILTIALLSLAGIPLTAGFIAKFYVLGTGIQHQLLLPVIVLVVTSVIGLYYYLRVISVMFAAPVPSEAWEKTVSPIFYNSTYIALVILALALVVLGIFPGLVVEDIRTLLTVR
jgi:NADH-quinone oxidoreductase subunit N